LKKEHTAMWVHCLVRTTKNAFSSHTKAGQTGLVDHGFIVYRLTTREFSPPTTGWGELDFKLIHST